MQHTGALDDWADAMHRDFLISVFYSERTSSMQPAHTGFVSDCCGTHTYERTGKDSRYCAECHTPCRERTLWSPNSTTGDKGGWNPAPVWVPGKGWQPREQVMYCNPTRSTRPTGQELRIASLIDKSRSLAQLVLPTPRHFRKGEWKLYRLAWEGAVHPLVNSYAEVVGMAASREWRNRVWPSVSSQRCIARTLAQWNERDVERWIALCRYMIVTRKRERPGDYPRVGKPPAGPIGRPALLSERLEARTLARAA
jgi:hypothetical protein